jgi:hypothetical protein
MEAANLPAGAVPGAEPEPEATPVHETDVNAADALVISSASGAAIPVATELSADEVRELFTKSALDHAAEALEEAEDAQPHRRASRVATPN